MMVIFVSQSDKKAKLTVRRILDSFANRIGTDTWRTVITAEGLQTVKAILKQHATKNMAVACHWLRSRHRDELLWIVGARGRFNEVGEVPINTTSKDTMHQDWENNWQMMPAMKAVTSVAALFHDIGKANDDFQRMLRTNGKDKDIYRHEWISCQILQALVDISGNPNDDDGWLEMLETGEFPEDQIISVVQKQLNKKLHPLPILATVICWLILSHHRLPRFPMDQKTGWDTEKLTYQDILTVIDASWGYIKQDDAESNVSFQYGLLSDVKAWREQVSVWSRELSAQKENAVRVLKGQGGRAFLSGCRISLMLADYYVSNQDAEQKWEGNCQVFANTDRKRKALKQKLDEHLLRVRRHAVKILRQLPRLAKQMDRAQDIRSLKHRSPKPFEWQDKAVRMIKDYRERLDRHGQQNPGWFIVNMASTGCGKTFANAKIMQAVAGDGQSLRYTLALGLRSLTLQTGDEYRNRIKLGQDELAVIIGSAAVQELHDLDEEDRENIFDDDVWYTPDKNDTFLDIILNGSQSAKNKALLYKPVLVTTIDHMMPAVEATRGGRYMLPFLRMMSSDLVIDEIDDFSITDLHAIARLVHLAGMMGRNVILSSATIPPDLALGFYMAYQSGWKCYQSFFATKRSLACAWCDEFKTQIEPSSDVDAGTLMQAYILAHDRFINKRCEQLTRQIVQRKAEIIHWNPEENKEEPQQLWEQKIMDAVVRMHDLNHFVDKASGKLVSIGMVRIANITPCVDVAKFLLSAPWPEEYEPRIMMYHSREVLLMRHKQERYLDRVLKRKGEPPEEHTVQDEIMRRHIDRAAGKNVIFIAVVSPVEEVGRDHDFDWAVVEPSSYRSFIQLAGRIRRHRPLALDIDHTNVAILEYNLKGIIGKSKAAFFWPGFEDGRRYRLITHDLKELVDEDSLSAGIDARPRIRKPNDLHPDRRLSDLEHKVMEDFRNMDIHGPAGLPGWLNESWWMTGCMQQLHPFRSGNEDKKLFVCPKDDTLTFYEQMPDGAFLERKEMYRISVEDDKDSPYLWLHRDYAEALTELIGEKGISEIDDKTVERFSHKYGEISFPFYLSETADKRFRYSDQFGLYEITRK